MKARVKEPYQVAHEDKVYKPGDVVDAPAVDVAAWVAAGYVEEVKAAEKAQPKAANKAQERSANKATRAK